MYSLTISELAENDISFTLTYIAKVLTAPMAANNLLDEIEKYENILEDTPEIYPRVPDEYLAKQGIRYVIIKNFMMFFTVNEEEKTVNVIRFLYGQRDWKYLLKQGKFI